MFQGSNSLIRLMGWSAMWIIHLPQIGFRVEAIEFG